MEALEILKTYPYEIKGYKPESMYFLLSRNIAFHPYAVLDVFSRVLHEPIEELLNSHEKQQYLLEDISEPQCNKTRSQYIEMIVRDTSMEPVFPKGSRLKIDTSEITDEGLVAVKLIGSRYPVVAFSYKDLSYRCRLHKVHGNQQLVTCICTM